LPNSRRDPEGNICTCPAIVPLLDDRYSDQRRHPNKESCPRDSRRQIGHTQKIPVLDFPPCRGDSSCILLANRYVGPRLSTPVFL
jgi:hypothetical protein